MGGCSPQFRGANQEEGIGAAFVQEELQSKYYIGWSRVNREEKKRQER